VSISKSPFNDVQKTLHFLNQKLEVGFNVTAKFLLYGLQIDALNWLIHSLSTLIKELNRSKKALMVMFEARVVTSQQKSIVVAVNQSNQIQAFVLENFPKFDCACGQSTLPLPL